MKRQYGTYLTLPVEPGDPPEKKWSLVNEGIGKIIEDVMKNDPEPDFNTVEFYVREGYQNTDNTWYGPNKVVFENEYVMCVGIKFTAQ